MPRYEDICNLARQTASQVTNSPENWLAFLKSAAYMHQYSFPNQLLIYAQRPTATACATMKYWNDKALHWIQPGSKSIMLLDNHSSRNGLKLVFDFADTYPKGYAPEYLPWVVDGRNRNQVYREVFFEDVSNDIENAFAFRAVGLLVENHAQLIRAMERVAPGSELAHLDEETRWALLNRIVQFSVTYMVCVRCGESTERLDLNGFADIGLFNSVSSIIFLGNTVQRIEKSILSQIATATRQIDSVAQARSVEDNRRITNEHKSLCVILCYYTHAEYRDGKRVAPPTWEHLL